MTSVLKSAVTVDNSDLVATDVRNAADVTLATNSNLDNVREGYSSVSANDTHVKHLEDALVAGTNITLTKNNPGGDETITIDAAGGAAAVTPSIRRVDNDTIVVDAGVATTQTVLDLATAGDWIGGSSLESADEWVHVYEVVASPGTYKLYDKYPNLPLDDNASRVFTAQVNQASSLNPSTVVYDGDSGEANVKPGMLLYVFDDAAYELGRGKGTGAAASNNFVSTARIVSVDTGTNTITLDTNGLGHQIYISDDDYIYATEAGPPSYRQVSGAWYKWIGSMWNDGSSNLVAANNQYEHNRRHNMHSYTLDESSDYTTTSTSFTDVDATALVLDIFTRGTSQDVQASFACTIDITSSGVYLDINIDGVRHGGDDGFAVSPASGQTNRSIFSFVRLISDLTPGTHTFTLQWKVASGTATMYAGAGTSDRDIHPQFSVREIN